jgi:hypothetical protein
LTSTPLVLHSRAQMTRKSTALRRSERDVMDNPLGFVVKASGLYRKSLYMLARANLDVSGSNQYPGYISSF